MKRNELDMNDLIEVLHVPFASSRREIYVPTDHDTIVAPFYNYTSARIFNLTNGFLIWYFMPPYHLIVVNHQTSFHWIWFQ